ncbi:uncharacterized protein LY79DRAFT_542413 [Colletotrichum navitas]|uniref:Uncharacterized protein n=1 Tax=Colletotrichum navitas TaxID=681940 RepID=A0AAD8Q8Z3_9PEZI|nr:uncharacterized protein LY79DRAFT_542413 [Colletotrichum navitas]KAK1597177.1 hypothetical protein LY79DRAFT_542413 [Colletotrichum navitas]
MRISHTSPLRWTELRRRRVPSILVEFLDVDRRSAHLNDARTAAMPAGKTAQTRWWSHEERKTKSYPLQKITYNTRYSLIVTDSTTNPALMKS